MNQHNEKYVSATIFVLASNETEALSETIKMICSSCNKNDIEKIIIVLKSKECKSYNQAEKIINSENEFRIEKYIQKTPDVVQCLAEIPPLAQGSHFVMISSDLEMDPSDIGRFIEKSKENPEKIICASKWLADSEVTGYGRFRKFGSNFVNRFAAVLFKTNAKDLFTLYQIYPISVYKRMKFNNPKVFPFEYTLKPIKAGVGYEEIPTIYKKRTEGKSNFNLIYQFKTAYLFMKTAVKIRFG